MCFTRGSEPPPFRPGAQESQTYCKAQLRNFQRSLDKLDAHNVKVVALSVGDEGSHSGADRETPLGVPGRTRANAAFVKPFPAYLQSTGFVLDPQRGQGP